MLVRPHFFHTIQRSKFKITHQDVTSHEELEKLALCDHVLISAMGADQGTRSWWLLFGRPRRTQGLDSLDDSLPHLLLSRVSGGLVSTPSANITLSTTPGEEGKSGHCLEAVPSRALCPLLFRTSLLHLQD